MATIDVVVNASDKLLASGARRFPRKRLLGMSLLFLALPAHAIPPPPPAPPLLRQARMTVSVRLNEASGGQVTKITKLCKISGKIPVYSDDGGATYSNAREITGCKMSWRGENLDVYVLGAKAISKNAMSYATARVGVVPPDALPLCQMCGPQPLADSGAEVRVSGKPKSMTFSLSPNPVSMLNAKPTVWLEAEVEIVD